MSDLRIVVRLVSQYGVDRIFPVCSNASRFAAIAGTKTLSPAVLAQVFKLGFAINVGNDLWHEQRVAGMMEPFMKEAA